MEENQISVSEIETAYKCSFAEDRRTVTVVIGTQWIQPFKLEFGEDRPADTGVTPEQFQVIMEVPIQDGFAMMAMAKLQIYSHRREQHARFGKSIFNEEFLIKLISQIQKLVAMKRATRSVKGPVTRKPLEKLVDDINNDPMKGDVGSKGREFAAAWFDKNLAKTGDVAETLFLVNALKLYKDEYARRHFQANQEDHPE